MFSRDEWASMPEGTEGAKILVARELVSKATFAHVVQHKGLGDDGFAAECLVKDVEWLGFTRIMLRSDNEPAIVALLKAALKTIRVNIEHVEQIGEEHPPERDPQANGAIENAVGSVKGLMRTQPLALESRLGHKVPPEHPIMAWLAQHTAFGLTTRIKGDDGQTAYERIRMRPFATRMLEFGELCRHKLNTRDAQQNGTFAARWGQGIFLGIDKMTGRYIIWDSEKIVQARSVQRMPDCQKWDKDKVASVALRPQQLHQPREPRVLFRDQENVAEVPKGDEPQRLARRLYIKASDVEAFGYTEGCPKCDHDLKYGFGRTTKGHSNACRTRITKELAKTDSGRQRIAAASGRLDNFLSDYVEKHSGQQVPAQGEQHDVVRRTPGEAPVFEPLSATAKEELKIPASLEVTAPKTAEDLLREEAIEATFNPGLWEPGTSLYPAPEMGETIDAPTMGEPAGMEISAVSDNRKKREFHGPLRVGHRQRKLQRQSHTTPASVSHMGSAPVPDEDSRWAESVQDASWQPTVSKPTRSIDQHILGFEETSGTWSSEDRQEVVELQKEILQLMSAIGCDLTKYSKDLCRRELCQKYTAQRELPKWQKGCRAWALRLALR